MPCRTKIECVLSIPSVASARVAWELTFFGKRGRIPLVRPSYRIWASLMLSTGFKCGAASKLRFLGFFFISFKNRCNLKFKRPILFYNSMHMQG
jgi:hypothetical protein